MRATELLVCGGCLVLALTSTFGDASPAWRPQGRFGKRTHMGSMPRVIDTIAAAQGAMPNAMDASANALYQNSDLAWLCTDPKFIGYSECSGIMKAAPSSLSSPSSSPLSSSLSSRMRKLKNLADFLNL